MTAQRAPQRHDRHSIVETALRLLDEHGLPDLTMRRLAAALDVQASALYWHFPSKQLLLAAVADRIEGTAATFTQPAVDWQHGVAREAVAIRDALLAYRDGAEVVMSTRALGLGSEQSHARLVVALTPVIDPDSAQVAATALLHFILGDATLVQLRIQADSLGVVADGVSPIDARARLDEAFQAGLGYMLAGLDSWLRRASPTS